MTELLHELRRTARALPKPIVDIVTRPEDFLALESDWRALESQSPAANIFLSWEWVSCWWRAFGDQFRPWILVARDPQNAQIVAMAPFVRQRLPSRRFGPFSEISFMGCSAASPDHLDALSAPGYAECASAMFAERLYRCCSGEVIRMDGISSQSALLREMLQHSSRGNALQWETVCPYGQLPDSWDAYLSQRSRRLRTKLRRYERHLGGDGREFRFRQVEQPAELPSAVSSMFRLHGLARRRHGQRGAFLASRIRDFHRDLATQLLERGRLRLQFIEVDGQPIATMYGFRYDNVVSFYQTGFDPSYSSDGPGFLMFAQAIRSAIEEGASEFDFLRGDHAYKYVWTDGLTRRESKIRLATSWAGNWLVRGYRAGRAARRICRAIRGRSSGA